MATHYPHRSVTQALIERPFSLFVTSTSRPQKAGVESSCEADEEANETGFFEAVEEAEGAAAAAEDGEVELSH